MLKQVEEELESIRQDGTEVEAEEADGLVYVILKDCLLPVGYSKKHTRLLLKVPLSYPNGNPDMFWTDPDLRLVSGALPASTSVETALGEQWLRFSWHPQKWTPGVDNLSTFLEFVMRRLQQLK